MPFGVFLLAEDDVINSAGAYGADDSVYVYKLPQQT